MYGVYSLFPFYRTPFIHSYQFTVAIQSVAPRLMGLAWNNLQGFRDFLSPSAIFLQAGFRPVWFCADKTCYYLSFTLEYNQGEVITCLVKHQVCDNMPRITTPTCMLAVPDSQTLPFTANVLSVSTICARTIWQHSRETQKDASTAHNCIIAFGNIHTDHCKHVGQWHGNHPT